MAYVSTESGRPLAIENHQLSKSLGLTDRLFVVSNRPLGSRYGRFLPSEYIRRQPSINGFLVRLKRVLAQTEAHQISEPVDLWDLEHYLTQRRKEIDSLDESRRDHVDADALRANFVCKALIVGIESTFRSSISKCRVIERQTVLDGRDVKNDAL